MALSFLFRSKLAVIFPVLLALLFTSIPTKWGMYKFLAEMNPGLIGLFPFTIPNEADWGYTFEELYGNGAAKDSASAKEYRNRLWGQTALVTGANSGTGYEISLALARLGVAVTMACRNPTRCHAAAEAIREDQIVKKRAKDDRGIVNSRIFVTTMTVDTSSLKSVRNFCQQYLNRMDDGDGNFMPLDMLFLNAGMPSPPPDNESLPLSEDGIEKVFATNVVGHHLMYKLLQPSIRRSDDLRRVPARVVLTSSAASYDVPYSYKVATDLETLNGVKASYGLYGQSKLAQILWARELMARLDADGKDRNSTGNPNSIVYANAAHPGAVATNIWSNFNCDRFRFPNFCKECLSRAQKLMWTSEEGALTLIYLGTAIDRLQKDNIRGQYFHPQSRLMKYHTYVKDDDEDTKDLQQRLWKFLDELVADFA